MYSVKNGTKLILGSGSPRRRELMQAAGLQFEVVQADCDESALAGEEPDRMVRRLAELKARSVGRTHKDAWVIGADTIVVINGTILGKPESSADAQRMLGLIQGKRHEVWGGIALLNIRLGALHIEAHRSLVQMIPMDADFIRRYVESGEPLDKAGSYAIQGIGASLVSAVEGSYTNVVGLNLAATVAALKRFDILV